MSQAHPGVAPDRDRRYRIAVWVAWATIMMAAGVAYAIKAGDGRSAFVRWRHQVHDFWRGMNIWDKYYFPNPPLLPITLSPLMAMPPVAGALAWFAIKLALASAAIYLCFRMVNASGRTLPSWVQGVILLLSLRPMLSDLEHGNINLMILFLVVVALEAWRRGYDVLAGIVLALAITYKVTPALFLPYFAYKRSWRTVFATLLGIGAFLLVVPSLFIGVGANGQALSWWWHRMFAPYLVQGTSSQQEPNQSMIGVLSRLLTEHVGRDKNGYNGTLFDLNFVALPPVTVARIGKGLSFGFLALLAFFCRTKVRRRDDVRLLGEFSLVVLAMLFLSERSWKHHFVTLLLPYTYLAYRAFVAPGPRRVRMTLAAALLASMLMIASTSSEFGAWSIDDQGHADGHKIAQFYGMFFWSGLVLFAATAWRVRAESALPPEEVDASGGGIPSPHLARDAVGSRPMAEG